MPKQLRELRERLLRAGVAPRHVRRYLGELADHFADLCAEEERAGRSRADAEAAALGRLGTMDDLARAMLDQPRLQSWCARAPWAAFGLVPLLALTASFFLACVYLWFGWTIFLPEAVTPFGAGQHISIFTLQNAYFQAGRAFYFLCPVLVGWGIVIVAVRQRRRAYWPAAGLALTAWMGGTAQIHASRTEVVRGLGHISMRFFLPGPIVNGIPSGIVHALVFLTATSLPYVAWSIYKRHDFVG